jgi:hypothetical protein
MPIPAGSIFLSFDCPACKVRIHSAPTADIVCPACGASIQRYESPTSLPDPYSDFDRASRIPAGTVVQGKRLLPYAFLDPILDCEAAYLLIPDGWDFEGGVLWNPDNPSMPARPWLRLSEPGSAAGIEFFPALTFAWNDNPYMQANPSVSMTAGAIEFHPPLDPLRAIEQIVLPRYRSLPGLKKLSLDALLQFPAGYTPPRAIPPSVHFTAGAAQAHLSYISGEREIEEVVTVVTECMQTRLELASGDLIGYSWRITHARSIYTPAGHLDEHNMLLQTLLSAVAPAPIWERRVQHVSQRMLRDTLDHTLVKEHETESTLVVTAHPEPEPKPDHTLERQCAFRKTWQNGDHYVITNDENYVPNDSGDNWTEV